MYFLKKGTTMPENNKFTLNEPITLVSTETLAAEMCRLRMRDSYEELYEIMQKERALGYVRKNVKEFKRSVFEVFVRSGDVASACHELTIETTPFELRLHLFMQFRKDEKFRRIFCMTYYNLSQIQNLFVKLIEISEDAEYAKMILPVTWNENLKIRLERLVSESRTIQD